MWPRGYDVIRAGSAFASLLSKLLSRDSRVAGAEHEESLVVEKRVGGCRPPSIDVLKAI
jgi:hypothetical protein